MKKINLIAAIAIVSIAAGALSPLAYAIEVVTPIPTPKVTPLSNSSAGIQEILAQFRKERQDFNAAKGDEDSQTALSLKERVASKKKAILAKIVELKKNKEEKRKAVLTRLLDIQIKQLGNTKERVAKMPNIAAEAKTSLNTAIDSAVASLTAKKAEIAAATTPEQLKQLAKDIKDLFKAKRDIVKRIVNSILSGRVDKSVVKAESRLAELNTAAQGNTAAEVLLASAKTKIDTAKTQIAAGKLTEAAESLKAAYKDMKAAVNLLTPVDATNTPNATGD